MEEVLSDSIRSSVSSPGSPNMYSTPSFSRHFTKRSEAFISVLRTLYIPFFIMYYFSFFLLVRSDAPGLHRIPEQRGWQGGSMISCPRKQPFLWHAGLLSRLRKRPQAAPLPG